MQEQLEKVAGWIADSNHVVVMTGAGVSAESGIPTFRDALEGYWSKFNAEDLATPGAFARNPEMVSKWYDERRQKVLECQPNAGHFAIAELESILAERRIGLTLLTQNVDGLHGRAGSTDVVEVHGSLLVWRCTKTGEEFRDLPQPFDTYPPPSPAGGLLRPGVVWFGEALPEKAIERSAQSLRECDVYLAIGTSGLVHPVAGFVHEASAAGAKTVEMNLDETPMTSYFNDLVRGRSGDVLPKLVDLVRAQEK